jgi:hypothetical protein
MIANRPTDCGKQPTGGLNLGTRLGANVVDEDQQSTLELTAHFSPVGTELLDDAVFQSLIYFSPSVTRHPGQRALGWDAVVLVVAAPP